MQYSIGEFSQITRVSVKALRLYHERGLLKPDFVDPESGYRYYAVKQVWELRVINELKSIGFSLKEIADILDQAEEDSDLREVMKEQKLKLNLKIKNFQESVDKIEMMFKYEREAMKDPEETGEEVEEKVIEDLLIAGHRMKARYQDAGIGFGKVGKAAFSKICGKGMSLCYDSEYKEEGADYETAFPVKAEINKEGIHCRVIPGGRALSVLHRGPYETLGESYQKMRDAVKENDLKVLCPSREIYHKGPGMILKGNPKKYVTEIQFMIDMG